jgi:hypothetical protein
VHEYISTSLRLTSAWYCTLLLYSTYINQAANEAYGASIREQRKLKDVLYKAEQESRRAAWMERKRLQEEEEAKKVRL